MQRSRQQSGSGKKQLLCSLYLTAILLKLMERLKKDEEKEGEEGRREREGNQSRVSHPQHYWHIGPDDSHCRGCPLHFRVLKSKASAEMPAAPLQLPGSKMSPKTTKCPLKGKTSPSCESLSHCLHTSSCPRAHPLRLSLHLPDDFDT